MTELRLLRMEPILARSMPSTAAASEAAARSAATDGSLLAGKGAEASGFGAHSIRCSNVEESVWRETPEETARIKDGEVLQRMRHLPRLTYNAAVCLLVRKLHVFHHAVVVIVKRCCAHGGPSRGGERARGRRLCLVRSVKTGVVQVHTVERGLRACRRRRVCGR